MNNSLETFTIPMAEAESAVIKKEFYDVNGDTKQQEASLVVYNNTYQPNTGIDYAMKDGKEFDVIASMSGKVVRSRRCITWKHRGNRARQRHGNALFFCYGY